MQKSCHAPWPEGEEPLCSPSKLLQGIESDIRSLSPWRKRRESLGEDREKKPSLSQSMML